MFNLEQSYRSFLEHREKQGLLRSLETSSKNQILDFSSNDSLNLSQHPALIQASIDMAQQYGTSISGARLLCNHQEIYQDIEQKIARLKGTQTALLFSSGFVTNSSVISALLNQAILKVSPLVFTDKHIHASIHEGIKLAGAKQIRFNHQDLNHLETRLNIHKDSTQPKFIFVESLYGMQGTITDIDRLCELSKQYGAFLYVDEAHAFGTYGSEGGGLCAHKNQVDVQMGNFGKALGGFGGFIACSQLLKSYLMNMCPGFIYSTALPPSVLGAQSKALDMIKVYEKERAYLHEISKYFKDKLDKTGIEHTPSSSHIVGLIFENESLAQLTYGKLQEQKIKTSFIRPPTVPKALLRVCLNIKHTKKDIDTLIIALAKLSKI